MDDLLLRRRQMMFDQEPPYLEIDPEVLWIYDYGTNDVYSNTDWNVD